MKNTPQNFIKIYGVLGIITGLGAIAAMITGQFFLSAICFTTGWLTLWNIGNLKDQIRKGKQQ